MRPVEPVQRQEPTPVRAPPPLQAKGRDDVDKTQATDTNQLPDSHVPSNIPSFLLSTMRLVPSFARSRTWDALGYSESMRTSFALSKAAIDPLTALQRLPILSLTRESDRRVVASLMLKKIPEEVAMSLQRIGIQDKAFHFECAHAAVSARVAHLYYPWSRSNPKLPTQLGRLQFSEHEKVTLLTSVIKSRLEEFPAYAKALSLATPESRFKVSLAWTATHAPVQSLRAPAHLGFPLSHTWLPDESMRASLVKNLVSKNPHLVLEFVKAAGIESPQSLREIAQSAAGSSGKFDYQIIPTLGIHDEASLIDIYTCGARGDAYRAVEYLTISGIKNPEALGSIVQLAADNLSSQPRQIGFFINAVVALNLTDRAVLQKVAHSLARFGWKDPLALASLGIETREEKLRFAALAAHHTGPPSHETLNDFGLTEPDDFTRVLIYAAKRRPTMVALRVARDHEQLTPLQKRAVFAAIASESPHGVRVLVQCSPLSGHAILSQVVIPGIQAMQASWGETRNPAAMKCIMNILAGLMREEGELELTEIPSVSEESPLGHMTRILKALEARVPEFHSGVQRITIDGAELSQEAASLLVASTVATAHHVRDNDPIQMPLTLMAGLKGLDEHHLSSRDYRKVLELLRSMYEESASDMPQLSTLIEITPEVWRADFAGALECVLGRAALYSMNPTVLSERIYVTNATLREQREAIGAALDSALAERLQLSSAGGTLKLAEKWGDLSPITVLLARFARSHPYEIPALREVVEHVLKGSFQNYRYDPERGQLPGFTPVMIERWKENPHRLVLCKAGESSDMTRDRALAEAQHIYSQLLTHIADVEEIGGTSNESSLGQARFLAHSKQDVFAREYKQIEKENPGSSWVHVVSSIGLLLKEGDREGVAMFLRNFATIRSRIGAHYPPEVRQQLSDDVNALSEVVKERAVDKSKGYLVFTTITDDPKLLMMVGDLVNTSSCQNYRTGSVVETLLGYVMDGNIKATLSFAIAEGHVRNLFKISHKDSFDPKRFSVSFDAPKLLLTLTDPDGESQTIPLGKAIRRRILRVGQRMNDAAPVMYAERPYQILHAVTSKMEAEEAALLNTVEKNCGFGTAEGDVEFPASGNPAGVYSDYGQGAMIGDYLLKLVPGKDVAPIPALNDLI